MARCRCLRRPIRQILINLILNAIQAAGRGGTVSCRIEADDAQMSFQVRNDGRSIPAELMEHLFEPFSSGSEGGSGLGPVGDLPDRRAASRHHPREKRAAGDGVRRRIAAGCRRMTARLCLIEDDPIMGESLQQRLSLEGFACDWHRTGAAALESIGREPYAAVVSDVRLPDLSGEALFRAALERDEHAPPFVFVTAYGSIDRAVELIKLGAADYVTKPFDVEQLIAKLRVLAGVPDEIPAAAGHGELGTSAAARRVEELLPRISQRADTVLITGESGVGKERVAQILHRARRCRRWRTVHRRELRCRQRIAARGRIVRARARRIHRCDSHATRRIRAGRRRHAVSRRDRRNDAGMQAKLLRAIQEREIVRVGGEKRIPVRLAVGLRHQP